MTIREVLEKRLCEHGMWPDEAKQVLKNAETHATCEAMKGRWDEQESGYPGFMLRVLWVSVTKIAVEWIDANKPKHFARSILTGVEK